MSRAFLPKNATVSVPLSGSIDTAAYHTFKRFDDISSGVTVTNAASAAVTTFQGMSVLKVVTNVAGLSEVQFTAMPDVTAPHYGKVCWLVYIENPADCTSMTQFYSPAGYPAKYAQLVFTVAGSNFQERSGWIPFTMHRGISTNTGSFSWDADLVSDAKLRVTAAASKQVTYYVHSFLMLPRMRAKFVISFDDNRGALLATNAGVYIRGVSGTHSLKDVLDAYGYKGTLYMVRSQISDTGGYESTGGISWAQAQTLKDAGWNCQLQISTNCASNDNQGAKLLGPYGYAGWAVASVQTTPTNTFTASAVHNMPSAGGHAYPIEFVGTDLPTGINTGTTYWARPTSTTAFTIHLTETDARNNTNVITLADGGTPTNYTYRYHGSANDDSAIYTDFQTVFTAIQSNLGVAPRFCAPNQGAIDGYVYSAYQTLGMKSLRTTSTTTFLPSLPTLSDFTFLEPFVLGSTMDYEDSTAYGTQAAVNSFIDSVIAAGGIGHVYGHSNTNPVALDWALTRIEYWQKLGACDVGTMSEVWDSLQ